MEKFKVGITGGIGSGKSTVCRLFAQWNVTIIDADALSHELTGPGGKAVAAIHEAFGSQAINAKGGMDRAYMRQRVFEDDSVRHTLQAIIHPLIRQEMLSKTTNATGEYVIYDIPLLVESLHKYKDLLNVICVVDCEESEQILRVQKRSGLSVEAIMNILKAQASREQRLAVANEVIFNGRGITHEQLQERAFALHQKWLLSARKLASASVD